ncbi:AAA family ATPase [Clostridium aciditolerans]|uniref:AAA family ATPase n=1 Tax=Clostridium aciditolerans TaxID=339861 RepID=A0A934HXN8_9CLOT|nr:AAA family ATPase [Clostridium aciditolerans]MBI6875223.1 AAA family ATPase [Clostridium aciditolerans]
MLIFLENRSKLNTVVISSDEIRKELMDTYEFFEKTNNLVFDNAKYMIKNALLEGVDVVFDATNTNSKNRKSTLKIAKEIGCKTAAIVFLTQMQICINKNLRRGKERQLPLEMILRMAKFNSDKINMEGFDEVKYTKLQRC